MRKIPVLSRWERLFLYLKTEGPMTAFDIIDNIYTTTPSKVVSELKQRMRNGWQPGWVLEEARIMRNGGKIKRWSVRKNREHV
jgi:hypothetical protein